MLRLCSQIGFECLALSGLPIGSFITTSSTRDDSLMQGARPLNNNTEALASALPYFKTDCQFYFDLSLIFSFFRRRQNYLISKNENLNFDSEIASRTETTDLFGGGTSHLHKICTLHFLNTLFLRYVRLTFIVMLLFCALFLFFFSVLLLLLPLQNYFRECRIAILTGLNDKPRTNFI